MDEPVSAPAPLLREIATTSHVMLERLALAASLSCSDDDDTARRCRVAHCPSRGLSWIELDGRPFAGLCVYTRVEGDTVRVTAEILDDVWSDRETHGGDHE